MNLFRRYGWVLFLLIAACFFGAQAVVPRDWATPAQEYSESRWIESIVVLNGWLYLAFLGVCLSFAVVLLILNVRLVRRKESLFKRGLCVVVLSAYPVSVMLRMIPTLLLWTYHGSVTTDNGITYYFLDSSFLQGQTMALAKLVERSPLVDRFEVLVTNNGDSPRSFARVVRPQGAEETYGQLYLSPSRLLVGIRHYNRCFLAYDLETGKRYGHGEIEKLSPFICIGEDDRLNPDDVEDLLQTGLGTIPGTPREDVVRQSLNHNNPEVRKIARQLLDGYTGEDATSYDAKGS